MSSGGQIGGAIVGGVVGFVASGFNPAGAYYGAVIGAGIGGYLDPPKGPTVEGPRLADKSIQTATYGAAITRLYGKIGISGNIVWLEKNQLKEVVKKKKQGGKGGGSTSTLKTYQYFATFILALGEGEIGGVRRIWCQDRLIYNAASDDLETIIASNVAANGFRVYRGTDDQLPDPRYEADVGVGNASAFRGTAYIAFYDFDLTDYGNSLQGAQFKVEVVQSSSVVPPTTVINQPQLTNQGYPDDPWRSVSYPQFLEDGIFAYLSNFYACYSVSVNGDVRLEELMQSPITNQPLRCVGDVKWANGLSDGKLVTDRKVYSDVYSGSTWPSYELHIINDYALFFISGNSLKVISVNPFVEADASQIIGMCTDGVYVYTLDSSFVVSVRDADSLVAVDTYHIDVPSQTAGVYLSVDEKYVWYCQNCSALGVYNQYVYCFDKTNGEKVNEFGGLNYSGISSVGAPGMVNSGFSMTMQNSLVVNRFGGEEPNDISVSSVIQSEVALSNLLSVSDLDVTLLSDYLSGAKISGGTIRSAIEPLQGAFPFDVISSGYKIKAVPRGRNSLKTISWTELGASNGSAEDAYLSQSREMDTQLPVSMNVKFIDEAREYAIAEESKARFNTPAVNRVDREFPIVLSTNKGAQVAESLLYLAWLERTDFTFSLPPSHLDLEPADVVTVVTPDAGYELRLTEGNVKPDGVTEWKAKPNDAALYVSDAVGGSGVLPDGTVGLSGATTLVLMDIPVVDETIQNTPGIVAALCGNTSSWPGASVYRSSDAGQTWASIQGVLGHCPIGKAKNVLSANSGSLIDGSALTVEMIQGELESITRDQMLSGMNYVAYGSDGRWEIMRFQSASLQSDGSYTITGFVRGERGTEWATGLHVVSDWFVLLDDPDLQFIDMSASSIGALLSYRGVTNGREITSATVVANTYRGVNLECLSPVYARGSRDGSGNFSGSFTRRSRISGSWWATGTPSPVGEESESYEIDVMSGTVVKRTIASSSPTFSYSATNQVADFGSTQSAISFRIYQISSVVGRGYPLEVTL